MLAGAVGVRLFAFQRLVYDAFRETELAGLKQGHLCEVTFDRTEVPLNHLIGSPGDAGKYMTIVWNANRPLIGLMALGVARRAYDIALAHVADRKQFGAPLAAKQLVQQDLSDMDAGISLPCESSVLAPVGVKKAGMPAPAARIRSASVP